MYQGEKERKRRKVGVVGASFCPLARFLDGEGGNGMIEDTFWFGFFNIA